MSDDTTRPISVAELLARNGTIGSPPVGGHRRRKRRNAVSVAELTGEIPVIGTGEISVVRDDEAADDGYIAAEVVQAESSETVVVYSAAADAAFATRFIQGHNRSRGGHIAIFLQIHKNPFMRNFDA